MNIQNSAIFELLQNYVFCEYPLNIEEIHRMLTVEIHRKELNDALQTMLTQDLIIKDDAENLYTVKGHLILFKKRAERREQTKVKHTVLNRLIPLLRIFPWIDAVYLTGSCALENATADDDIDLMIITTPNTLFICRLYTFIVTKLLGLARKRSVSTQANSICINIWLDRNYLEAPETKSNTYSAREVANAQVIFDKNNSLGKFISVNPWVLKKLPNWLYEQNYKASQDEHITTTPLLSVLNNLLGRMQLWYMRAHVTNEIVGMTQLWFHPKLRH